jgi:hypothetical protein
MLAKRTSKNQITLPKAIVGQVAYCDYFDVTLRPEGILLTPVEMNPVRQLLDAASNGPLSDADLAEAIKWAKTNHDPVAADKARQKVAAHVAALGITEEDVAQAVRDIRSARS